MILTGVHRGTNSEDNNFHSHLVHHSYHTECSLRNLQRLIFDITDNTEFPLERPYC